MQLNAARLCLNCEEVHAAHRCPRCASETFAYLTRWVPRVESPSPPARPILTPTRMQRIVFGGGVVSVAAYVVMRWMQRARNRVEIHSWRAAGELR